MGSRLLAVVASGDRERIYLGPNPEHEAAAAKASSNWVPDGVIVEDARAFTPTLYGLARWADLLTTRQLMMLTTLSDLVQETRELVHHDVLDSYPAIDTSSSDSPTSAAVCYSNAIGVYLSCALSQISRYCATLAKWNVTNENIGQVFGLQALQMVWDYAEANAADGPLDIARGAEWVANALESLPAFPQGVAMQSDAQRQSITSNKVVSTDPPYYDNVPYADLSDFFYIWLRKALQSTYPGLFGTLAAPKDEELVVTSYRHGGKSQAEVFFVNGMTEAMRRVSDQAHPAFPVTIYYAFKQAEGKSGTSVVSTGWETFLEAVARAGLAVSGTWPVRTERPGRLRETGSNALASSIILVCRKRNATAPSGTRREFYASLRAELPLALRHLQGSNIAPVDMAQSAIGPGMAIFTRYSEVLDAVGNPLTVREALALINHALDEALATQEGDFDTDTRWALTWFDQLGFAAGEYGSAETLATARNTSVKGLVDAGFVDATRGKVRLLAPHELRQDWDPATDRRLTHWDAVHHLIRVLESDGEPAAAELIKKLGSKAEVARELAYRLYTICERKNRSKEALSYNGLVQSWPEMLRLAQSEGRATPTSTPLFGEA